MFSFRPYLLVILRLPSFVRLHLLVILHSRSVILLFSKLWDRIGNFFFWVTESSIEEKTIQKRGRHSFLIKG